MHYAEAAVTLITLRFADAPTRAASAAPLIIDTPNVTRTAALRCHGAYAIFRRIYYAIAPLFTPLRLQAVLLPRCAIALRSWRFTLFERRVMTYFISRHAHYDREAERKSRRRYARSAISFAMRERTALSQAEARRVAP